jgi:hypothetical protein
MTKITRNDRRDISPAELKLIRVGHLLWLERRSALKSEDVRQVRALDEALETVWQLKRQVRAEEKALRAEKSAKLKERFRPTLPKAA